MIKTVEIKGEKVKVRQDWLQWCWKVRWPAIIRTPVVYCLFQLQIWDTAGQERFRSITQSYYRSANALILTYDITCEDSFRCLPEWLREIEQYANNQVVTILVGKKIPSYFLTSSLFFVCLWRASLLNRFVKRQIIVLLCDFFEMFAPSFTKSLLKSTTRHTYTSIPICSISHTHTAIQSSQTAASNFLK